jgi:beta-N-acetylhexosaminidase
MASGVSASPANLARRPAASKAPATASQPIPAAWRRLAVRDEVAQLVIVAFTGQALKPRSQAWRELSGLVHFQHVGGLILVNVSNGRLVQRADPVEAAGMINRLQRLAKIPLVVGGDLERGASMRFSGTTVFPHAMAFAAAGDPAAARYEGVVTAREARAIGVNWVFFPDADVNSNPDNPIINIRSYSEDPRQVSEYVDAFLEGAASDPHFRVLTTAKHFPGHGDTDIDTHLNMATVTADRKHLDEVELAPFRSAIAHGVDSIMTAHLAVPALGTGDVPATLSPEVLTTLLRGELGFKGLIVTDALDMGGVAKGFSPGDAAVRAIEAGADVLLMPADPMAAINAVAAAVKEGRISKKRLDESLERVLAAKARVGLAVTRYVNARTIYKAVNLPASNQRAMEIAQRAVTLLKNDYHLLPVAAGSQACFAILREGPNSQEGQAMQPEINKRAPGRPALLLDPGMSEADLDRAVAQAGTCDAWYVAAFVSVAGYRGNVALGGQFPQLIGMLLTSGKPVMLLSLGNPYLLRSFPNVSGYLTTFSTVPPSEIAAVEALYGEIPIGGHMPISIPGLIKFGDGIAMAAVAAAPRSTK